jgi:hypothetical protein
MMPATDTPILKNPASTKTGKTDELTSNRKNEQAIE